MIDVRDFWASGHVDGAELRSAGFLGTCSVCGGMNGRPRAGLPLVGGKNASA